jgi:hypothetical protein
MDPNVSPRRLNVTLEGHDITSKDDLIGFNNLNLCKNWIFHVIWLCRPVDHLSNTGGQLMCHEEMHHQMLMLSKTFGPTGQCLAPTLYFVIGISAPLRGLIM